MKAVRPRRGSEGPGYRGLLRRSFAALVACGCLAGLAAAQDNAACLGCHDIEDLAVVRDGRSISLRVDPEVYQQSVHGKLDCIACHTDLKGVETFPHARRLARVACDDCHDDDDGPIAAYEASVHGQKAAAKDAAAPACQDCHGSHAIARLRSPDSALAPARQAERCGKCHAPAAEAWARSVHAGDPGNGRPAATCSDCHGGHDVRAARDPASKVYPLRLPDTCESCHHPDPSPEHPAPAGAKVAQYETSAHGRALRVDGLIVTATCASCHGAHEIRAPQDPAAPTARRAIPYTCGACHAGILAEYLDGVHGADFESGGKDVPVCNDCHREHAVLGPSQSSSSVSAALVAETCARCHADGELSERYGFRGAARASWGSSYHGIASSFGAEKAANCASCHGFHAILPSSDARSPVHPQNLDATCGKCHAGASAAFAKVPVHSVIERQANFVPWAVKYVYTVLVAVLIGAFVLFILLDLFGRLRLRLGWGPRETEHVDPERWPDEDRLVAPNETFLRMSRHGRLQHVVLVLSFLILVATGIPVFLHDSAWMRSIVDIEGGFELRSRLHRVGAAGLVLLSAWHLATLALVPAARRWFAGMIITPRDLKAFVQDLMFDLGLFAWLSRRRALAPFFARHPGLKFAERPCLGRYGLVEKLEYGAVLWGNLVMIATGFILWRPGWFLAWCPVWTFDVCRVVHGFEATLAFLAIIIWHMYHVHLRPGVFPMSRVWLNGRIARAELRHHHPAEYLKILEQRRGELAPAPPPAPHAPRPQAESVRP